MSDQEAARSGYVARDSHEDRTFGFLDHLEDRGLAWEEEEGLHVLPGPHKFRNLFPTKRHALIESTQYNRQGKNIIYAEKLALEFGTDTAINMVFPSIIFVKKPFVTDLVVVAHPKDAERVAKLHVKKSLVYGDISTFLGDGVLSTRNVDSWQEQRTNLVEGFLPLSSLAKIMPISVQRADYAVQQKMRLTAGNPTDVCEFYLFEAMTQLHLPLLGEDKDFSESNNVALREAFATMLKGPGGQIEKWKSDRALIRSFSKDILDHARDAKGDTARSAPYRAQMVGCPVVGPVAAKLAENVPGSVADPLAAQRDSASTISFAGFDTTALNMTWVTFEMCRRPELQRRLQAEVDMIYDSLGDRELAYEDLPKFEFLTKVINETLRLWWVLLSPS